MNDLNNNCNKDITEEEYLKVLQKRASESTSMIPMSQQIVNYGNLERCGKCINFMSTDCKRNPQMIYADSIRCENFKNK